MNRFRLALTLSSASLAVIVFATRANCADYGGNDSNSASSTSGSGNEAAGKYRPVDGYQPYTQAQVTPSASQPQGTGTDSSSTPPQSNDSSTRDASSGGQSEPHARMLQAEVGATGHYDEPTLNSQVGTQNPAQAPAPPLYGQAGAPGQSPLYGQAGAGAPYQQPPLFGQAGAGAPYQQPPLYGQAMGGYQQRPPYYGQAAQPGFYGQAAQPGFANQAPFQASAYSQPAPMYQSSVAHGQMTIGVLGAEFGMLNNQIRQILPGSDLLRYGITPGDIIEAADGQPLRGKAMQAYIRGTPGTYVQLTILHRGQLVTIPVERKDTREFQSYNSYFQKWAAKEKFW